MNMNRTAARSQYAESNLCRQLITGCLAFTRKFGAGSPAVGAAVLFLAGPLFGQTAKTAQATFTGKAIQMPPSNPAVITGVGSVTIYYSTYNGTNGSLLVDTRAGVVSGEIRPRAGSTNLFEGAYLGSTPVAVVDYGYFAAPFPTADVDGDGTIDVIQFDRSGSFTAVGSGFSTSSSLTFSITIQFSRAAGNATGSYSATTINSAGGSSTVGGIYALA